ncbi:MAG TPA: hypothetical protein PLL33_02270 [Paracoccus sp. (in: a-proteobacteria)]|nr:hypothetical protein [Paracoccus sp. (in: a-proteobacteria)]
MIAFSARPEGRAWQIRDSSFRSILQKDFAAGVQLGESVEKDRITVRIGADGRLVAADSPDCLAARGRPEHPQELIRHIGTTCAARRPGSFMLGSSGRRGRSGDQPTFNSPYVMTRRQQAGMTSPMSPKTSSGGTSHGFAGADS